MFTTNLQYLTTIKLMGHDNYIVHGCSRLAAQESEISPASRLFKSTLADFEVKKGLLYSAAKSPAILPEDSTSKYQIELGMLITPINAKGPREHQKENSACYSSSVEGDVFEVMFLETVPLTREGLYESMSGYFLENLSTPMLRQIGHLYFEYFLGYQRHNNARFEAYT